MRPRVRPPIGHCWLLLLLLTLLLAGCSVGSTSATPTPAPTPRTVGSAVVPGSPTAASGPAVTATPVVSGTTAPAPTTVATAPASPTLVPTATVRVAAPTPTPQPGQKPTPRGSQVLTMAGPETLPDTLDPALIRDHGTVFIARQVFRGLVRLDDALNVVPDIAADYRKSADGRSYTFFLRATAKFQDGKPITADDIAFSLRRACDPATARDLTPQNLPAASGLDDIVGCTDRLNGRTNDIAGITVLDPLTITLTLDAPKAYFLQKLTLIDAAVVDKNDLARGPGWFTKPNGSGPFRLAAWKPDEINLARYDGFYDQVASLEKVVLLIGARGANPVNLYDASAVDIASANYGAVDRLNAATSPDKGQLRVTPQLSTVYIGVNSHLAPLDAFNVRAALIRTIDRQKVQAVAYDGKVAPVKGFIPPAIPGGDWSAAVPVLDPKVAKDLLPPDKAKTLPPILYGSSGDAKIGNVVKTAAERDLGLHVDIEDETRFDDLLTDLDTRGYGLFMLGWVADYPDPENFLVPLFHTGAPANHGGYSNPKVDDLLDRAAVEQDAMKRADLYRQAQQQIIDDVAVIPLYHPTDYTLVKPYVKGLTITAMGILRLETVWIERDNPPPASPTPIASTPTVPAVAAPTMGPTTAPRPPTATPRPPALIVPTATVKRP